MDRIAWEIETIGRIAAVPAILQAVAHTTGLRFAAVARVTDTSWIACAVHDQIDFGLKPGGQLVLESTLCNEIRQHHEPIVFGHASSDPRYVSHPTPKLYGFESYISIPIFRVNGEFFGTLCALDPLPAKLDDPNVLKTLELFTQLIAAQLEIEERLEESDRELATAMDMAKLREQFIAVLGHDLRNPLQAIMMGTDLLKLAPLGAGPQRNVNRIQRSCERMAELIDNTLDFARGRLGGGIPVALTHDGDLGSELRQVVFEINATHPQRAIEVSLEITQPVICDCRRIAQLLANLLGNAMTHGDGDQPVRVAARCQDGFFELSVTNSGPAIPEDKRALLFQPFTHSALDAPRPGLGLGLYIAAEIAKAHNGTLEAFSSDAEGTRFVFRMPAG